MYYPKYFITCGYLIIFNANTTKTINVVPFFKRKFIDRLKTSVIYVIVNGFHFIISLIILNVGFISTTWLILLTRGIYLLLLKKYFLLCFAISIILLECHTTLCVHNYHLCQVLWSRAPTIVHDKMKMCLCIDVFYTVNYKHSWRVP